MGRVKECHGVFGDMPQLCQESQGTPGIHSQTGLDAKMTQDLLSGCVLTA